MFLGAWGAGRYAGLGRGVGPDLGHVVSLDLRYYLAGTDLRSLSGRHINIRKLTNVLESWMKLDKREKDKI